MKKIFVDTNILLDVMLAREEFYSASSIIFADAESRKINAYVSAISLNNMHFIMRKFAGKESALFYVRQVLNIFNVVPLDVSILKLAVDLPHKDFEDAIQTFSAVQVKADFIVTRDEKHFSSEYVPILSPAQYVDLMR